MTRREPSCEGFFRQAKQKPQEILDGLLRIFVRYNENKTRRFGREEYLEVPFNVIISYFEENSNRNFEDGATQTLDGCDSQPQNDELIVAKKHRLCYTS